MAKARADALPVLPPDARNAAGPGLLGSCQLARNASGLLNRSARPLSRLRDYSPGCEGTLRQPLLWLWGLAAGPMRPRLAPSAPEPQAGLIAVLPAPEGVLQPPAPASMPQCRV